MTSYGKAKGRRIGIFVPWSYVEYSPCVLNLATLLAQNGYHVDIFQLMKTKRFLAPTLSNDHVQFHYLEPARPLANGLERLFVQIPILPFLRDAFHSVRQLPDTVYSAFIGVDQKGILVASVAGLLRGVPVIFHDTELVITRLAKTSRHRSCLTWLLHAIQRFRHRVDLAVLRYAIRRAPIAISLDEERADWLIRLAHIPCSKVVIIPNSPLGHASGEKSGFLRNLLDIPVEKKIILHAGAIAQWSRCLPIARAALQWPDDWVLVLHGFVTDEGLEVLRELQEIAASPQVVLSLDPVPYGQLDQVYRSCNIGLALYEDRGPNWTHVAGASGKLINYLKCGLPVVTTDLPSLRRVVRNYQCGLTVKQESEVAGAISQILADYEVYSANALRCYDELYDLERYFPELLSKLERILQ